MLKSDSRRVNNFKAFCRKDFVKGCNYFKFLKFSDEKLLEFLNKDKKYIIAFAKNKIVK